MVYKGEFIGAWPAAACKQASLQAVRLTDTENVIITGTSKPSSHLHKEHSGKILCKHGDDEKHCLCRQALMGKKGKKADLRSTLPARAAGLQARPSAATGGSRGWPQKRPPRAPAPALPHAQAPQGCQPGTLGRVSGTPGAPRLQASGAHQWGPRRRAGRPAQLHWQLCLLQG